MSRNKILAFVSVFFLTILPLKYGWTQVKSISGKVVGTDNKPITGVSVVRPGTGIGTVTDENGRYAISNVAPGDTLLYSYIGMASHAIIVGAHAIYNVVLLPEASQLGEVVAIGYGSVKKSDLTGSVASIKGSQVNAFPTTNVLQAISGRAAGVQVIQNTGAPGAAVSVRIRGANSIQGSNEPLYVIDGFPITGSNPTILNNGDIESIEILKDASATSIYGSRGANGVVLITTKRGKAGRTVVDYESTFGFQQLRKHLDMMNATEFAKFYNEVAAAAGTDERFPAADINSFGEGFDWQNFVFHKALMQNHNLTVNGGNDKTQISTSVSVFTQDGIIKNSGYDRYSLRANVHHKLSDKIRMVLSTSLSRINNTNQSSSGGGRGNSLISGALYSFPTVTPYKDDGSIRNLGTIYPWTTEINNPAYFIDESRNKSVSNKVLSNLSLEWKIIPDLTLRLAGGIEYTAAKSDYYQTTKFVNSNSSASVSRSDETSLLNENTLNYSKSFNKHKLSATAGFTYQDFLYTGLSATGTGFLSDAFETYNIGAAAAPGIPQTSYTKSALLSALGRINYDFDDLILATLNFRSDGSSKYSTGNKWGYFPSGALAVKLSNFDFLKNSDVVRDLKLRVGWGVTGSQAIAAYATLNNLASGKTVLGDALYTTFGPGTILASSLKWETTEQTNIGLDGGFFNNRLGFSIDYYKKVTRDLLNAVPLSSSTGYARTIRNVGSLQNSGVELNVNGSFSTGLVRWDVNGNISFNRSKVLKLANGDDILGATYNVTLLNDAITLLREGQPFGVFYGYREKSYNENGLIQYEDISGDGTINQLDKVVIGNPNPDFIYGLNAQLTYKNFGLTVFLQGVNGNDIFNLSSVNNTLDVGFGGNMPREVYTNHWSAAKQDAKYPLPSTKNVVRVSDRFIEDGSYLRLRNIQLSYNLPLTQWGIQSVRNLQIFIGGQNLLTFTKYSWWDPEVNSSGGSNSINQGIDYHTYPNYKSVMFGVRAQF